MASVYFESFDAAEVIEVELVTLQGGIRSLKLLVDTGFSGRSSVILDVEATEFFRAALPATQTSGALQGPQQRVWVTCRIPVLGYEGTVIAIVTDLSNLSLPAGVEGMVGLSFLRQFARWGAERTEKEWSFFLFNDAK